MEIEDLKYIWKKESAAFAPKDTTELAAMLKGRSSSIVTRLKFNVWFELVFTFLGGLALLGYAITLPGGGLKWTSISILVLFAAYSLYYVKKLRLLNRVDFGHQDLRESLQRLVLDLKGYLRFYRRSYSILYPVYFILGLLFTAIERGADGFLAMISRPQVMITLIFGAGLFFVCSSWLTSWYLKKLYGNHLEKLESLLDELEG